MATYKVLQDIEAEDTLVGPLTLRQCIYAAVAALAGYLCVISVMKGAAFLVVLWLPFLAFGVFFAFPWSRQQPTEVWALAKVRFMFKPRKRIWNQSGVKELVTITAPKVTKTVRGRNLSAIEVQNRLRALADTIDSRGWAVKNIDLSAYTQAAAGSDRLVDASALPQEVQAHDASAHDDIFDLAANPVAQKFDAMMVQAANQHREQLMTQLTQPTVAGGVPQATPAPNSYWHMKTILPRPVMAPTASGQAGGGSAAMIPTPTAAVATAAPASLPSAPAPAASASQTLSLIPTAQQIQQTPQATAPRQAPAAAMTDLPNPAILELANNNDLNVATLAREAQARSGEPPEEVSVSFH